MKIRTTLIAAIALVILTFSACDKDEEVKKNSFKYNNKEAEIGTAFGFQEGETEIAGVYGITMIMFEKTLTLNYENQLPESLSGKGDVLLVTFLTDKIDEIPSGEYNLNSSTANAKAFTIDSDESAIMVDIVSFDLQPSGYIEFLSGKTTVAKNGNEYEISLNVNTTVNSTITAYYKGTPIIYSDLKKKTAQDNAWFPL
jgi:hypothetical protein